MQGTLDGTNADPCFKCRTEGNGCGTCNTGRRLRGHKPQIEVKRKKTYDKAKEPKRWVTMG